MASRLQLEAALPTCIHAQVDNPPHPVVLSNRLTLERSLQPSITAWGGNGMVNRQGGIPLVSVYRVSAFNLSAVFCFARTLSVLGACTGQSVSVH